jgi:glucose-6-phosphate dehydrogenase assembly protein OpcA
VETPVTLTLDQQLRALWPQDGPERLARASLFNLITIAGTAAERDRVVALLPALTQRHPCRAIIALVQPDAPAAWDATVTALCHLAGGRKQVCCEQIQLTAAGDRVPQLMSAILPVLEADLPTVVWWPGNFLAQPDLAGRLVAVADRWLYDTGAWPAVAWTALREQLQRQTHCRFGDLNWTRLALWRQLTADSFDSANLPVLNRLTVTHGNSPGSRTRALLYAGWAATQLGWSPEDTVERVTLAYRPEDDCGLLAVELTGPGATVAVRKNFGEWTATATVTGAPPRKQAFAPLDDAALLAQEFDHPQPHTVYERAVANAALLAAATDTSASAGA